MVLQLSNVTKRYKDFTAVDHLNFSIDKGECLATGLKFKVESSKFS